MSLLNIGTLETGNDGDSEVHALDGLDETSGDSVTSDDTTEDVDKDSGDLSIAGDELESLSDSSGSGTTTNVEEVSGLASVQLDDIHGSHGKTGTVDKAADITVKLDEVEVGLSGADLIGVLLGGVAPLKDILLSELSVVVETELGVHAENLVVGGLGEGVDLNLGRVLLGEDLIELLDGVLGLLDALLAEAELSGNLAGNLVGDTDVDVDVVGVDGIGGLLGDGLNVHTALGRRDDDGALVLTVHEDGEVELTTSKLALANVDSVAETAASARLLGDEVVADHLLGEHLGLVGRVDDTDTALQAVVERTLSSATGKDLGLDNHIIVANLLSDLLGLLGGLCDGTFGDTNAVLLVVSSRGFFKGESRSL